MLKWLFKKRGSTASPEATPATLPAARATAETKARQAEDARAEWLPRLQLAQGDDAALLSLAQATPVLEFKLAAVEALVSEEALKQAEREFRSHDRRVHRLAKQRLEAAVAKRETKARAQSLIGTAAALSGETLLPVNRLVTLDRDWQALDAGLLDASQRAEFASLRERLDALVRERGELQLRVQRWTTDATRALAALQAACAGAAATGSGTDLALAIEAARSLRESKPETPPAEALDASLQQALEDAARIDARLTLLVALEQPADTAVVEVQDAVRQWQALPPLASAELARALDERIERWRRVHTPARAEAAMPTAPAHASVAPSAAQLLQLDALLQAAEAALAEGQLGEMQQQLQAVDAALARLNRFRLDDALLARLQPLHAERARLKGWQQWGGGLARDGVLAEAEELARITLVAADPEASAPVKLHVKAHGDAIHALRMRWKELDHQGAPANQELWQRFDAALQTAYQPVAAHQAALQAARQENLAAREALLAALEAVPLEVTSEGAEELAAHWKEQLRALDRFQLAWRQLGPLEHTAPASARASLQHRLRGSVERIEAPLKEARRVAEAEREQFIVRAEALKPGPGLVAQVRELQAEWQQHARSLPLSRPVEGALWARFKAATDALFARREAEFSAREAELAASLATREDLLTRLDALPGDSTETPRALAEIDHAWRQAAELPRGAGGAVEARYRASREAAARRLADHAQQRWQIQCDTLAAKLALCEARASGACTGDDFAPRWAALEALPAAWESALAQRLSPAAEPVPLSPLALDDVLLKLEVALDIPAPPEWQAARRDLKLREMKAALERGASTPQGPSSPVQGFTAALRQKLATPAQRERLTALISALRTAPPGTLLPPTTRD
jgi:hypothetical protein